MSAWGLGGRTHLHSLTATYPIPGHVLPPQICGRMKQQHVTHFSRPLFYSRRSWAGDFGERNGGKGQVKLTEGKGRGGPRAPT